MKLSEGSLKQYKDELEQFINNKTKSFLDLKENIRTIIYSITEPKEKYDIINNLLSKLCNELKEKNQTDIDNIFNKQQKNIFFLLNIFYRKDNSICNNNYLCDIMDNAPEDSFFYLLQIIFNKDSKFHNLIYEDFLNIKYDNHDDKKFIKKIYSFFFEKHSEALEKGRFLKYDKEWIYDLILNNDDKKCCKFITALFDNIKDPLFYKYFFYIFFGDIYNSLKNNDNIKDIKPVLEDNNNTELLKKAWNVYNQIILSDKNLFDNKSFTTHLKPLIENIKKAKNNDLLYAIYCDFIKSKKGGVSKLFEQKKEPNIEWLIELDKEHVFLKLGDINDLIKSMPKNIDTTKQNALINYLFDEFYPLDNINNDEEYKKYFIKLFIDLAENEKKKEANKKILKILYSNLKKQKDFFKALFEQKKEPNIEWLLKVNDKCHFLTLDNIKDLIKNLKDNNAVCMENYEALAILLCNNFDALKKLGNIKFFIEHKLFEKLDINLRIKIASFDNIDEDCMKNIINSIIKDKESLEKIPHEIDWDSLNKSILLDKQKETLQMNSYIDCLNDIYTLNNSNKKLIEDAILDCIKKQNDSDTKNDRLLYIQKVLNTIIIQTTDLTSYFHHNLVLDKLKDDNLENNIDGRIKKIIEHYKEDDHIHNDSKEIFLEALNTTNLVLDPVLFLALLKNNFLDKRFILKNLIKLLLLAKNSLNKADQEAFTTILSKNVSKALSNEKIYETNDIDHLIEISKELVQPYVDFDSHEVYKPNKTQIKNEHKKAIIFLSQLNKQLLLKGIDVKPKIEINNCVGIKNWEDYKISNNVITNKKLSEDDINELQTTLYNATNDYINNTKISIKEQYDKYKKMFNEKQNIELNKIYNHLNQSLDCVKDIILQNSKIKDDYNVITNAFNKFDSIKKQFNQFIYDVSTANQKIEDTNKTNQFKMKLIKQVEDSVKLNFSDINKFITNNNIKNGQINKILENLFNNQKRFIEQISVSICKYNNDNSSTLDDKFKKLEKLVNDEVKKNNDNVQLVFDDIKKIHNNEINNNNIIKKAHFNDLNHIKLNKTQQQKKESLENEINNENKKINDFKTNLNKTASNIEPKKDFWNIKNICINAFGGMATIAGPILSIVSGNPLFLIMSLSIIFLAIYDVIEKKNIDRENDIISLNKQVKNRDILEQKNIITPKEPKVEQSTEENKDINNNVKYNTNSLNNEQQSINI